MLDNLYENIGSKIKNWAKWIFIVEAIGAIITGVVLMATDEDLIVYGLLTLVCGPIIAWVGSWILYAFGELVEDIHAIRNKEGIPAEEAGYETKKEIKHKFEEKVKNESKISVENNQQSPYKRKISYSCIDIIPTGKKAYGTCVVCKTSGVDLEENKIKTEIGTRTLNICAKCFNEFFASRSK